MPFFNFIYHTYSQDHKEILKLGLLAYLIFYSGIYSGYLPINCFDETMTALVKKYAWVLALIDYITLNLLHYFQTGTYLIKSKPIVPKIKVPRYVALDNIPEEVDEPETKNPIVETNHQTKKISPPFDTEYQGSSDNEESISDDSEVDGVSHNESLDDENYFDENKHQTPKIVDNYAMKQSTESVED